jgi:hypothetical protein
MDVPVTCPVRPELWQRGVQHRTSGPSRSSGSAHSPPEIAYSTPKWIKIHISNNDNMYIPVYVTLCIQKARNNSSRKILCWDLAKDLKFSPLSFKLGADTQTL